MNDRLLEIKRNCPPSHLETDGHGQHSDRDRLVRHDANRSTNNEGKFMKSFFGDVELVKQNIIKIINATEQIGEMNQEVSMTTTAEREHELTSGLTPLITDTNKRAALTKSLLQRLREECDQLKITATSTNSTTTNSSTTSPPSSHTDLNELRIRDNLINTLTRKFVDVMKGYQNAQQVFKVELKKKMKRQVLIVKPDATQDEIEEVMKTGGGTGEIYKTAILKSGVSDSVKNVSRNVQDKYHDVQALESSVAQLHEMFVDFAQLTEQQGELLDQIEHQVKNASDYIDEGNMDMTQAVDYAIQLRKKQLCLFLIVLVILGAIVGIVFAVKGQMG